MSIGALLSLILEFCQGVLVRRFFKDLIENVIDVHSIFGDLNSGTCSRYWIIHDLTGILNQAIVLQKLELHGFPLQLEHLDLNVLIHSDQRVAVNLLHPK